MLSTTAAVITAAVVLSGCDGDTSAVTSPRDSGARSPFRPAQLQTLVPVRPDERPIGRGEGTGPATQVITGTTTDVIYVYGVCAGGASELSVRVTLPRPEDVRVLCDGIVSRTQVYVNPGLDFGVDVEAARGLDWRVLVTRRATSG